MVAIRKDIEMADTERSIKPVVSFDRFIGWGKHPHSGEMNASLGGIKGHPRLGSESIVHTSRVERIGYADDGSIHEIETRNTIYRLSPTI